MLNKWIPCVFSIAACVVSVLGAEPISQKQNILFIAVDDLRPELGCYGKNYIKSSNIDRLAATGLVFDRAYCQQAICGPSRSSLLTGMRPDTIKVWDIKTHFRVAQPNVVTLLQNFKNNGYFVQGMGKIFHGGRLNDEPSWSVPWKTPKADRYVFPRKPLPVAGESDDAMQKRGPIYECADVPDNTYTDGKVAELAVQTLREISVKPEPFFLAVGFVRPHLPWVSPKKYWDMYDVDKIEVAPNSFYPKGAPDYAINRYNGELYHYWGLPAKGTPIGPELARKLKQAYFAGVSYVDAQVGKVIAELDQLGLRENTIIILWGDHGWKLGEHASWGKHSNVECDVNVPLMISVPGMKNSGMHTDALVEFVDVYPTLSELAGLPLPGHLEGTSFKPVLDDPDRPWKTAAFSQYQRNQNGGLMGYSMRTDRYRFTVWVDRQSGQSVDSIELYDHQVDPQENSNIADDPENSGLVRQLMTQWEKGWQGACADL